MWTRLLSHRPPTWWALLFLILQMRCSEAQSDLPEATQLASDGVQNTKRTAWPSKLHCCCDCYCRTQIRVTQISADIAGGPLLVALVGSHVLSGL